MARKDVVDYFLQQQQVMTEAEKTAKEFDLLFKQGKITKAQLDEANSELDIVKANYTRIAYIMFLLNKPKRKEKQIKEEKVNQKWYDYLQGSSKEAILDESKDALADFKKLVEEARI